MRREPNTEDFAFPVGETEETMGKAAASPAALVVEDDTDQRSLLCDLLGDCNLQLFECATGEHALAVLEEHGSEILLMFTDGKLAGAMSGAALATVVRQRFPHIRVIVVSGDHQRGLPSGTTFLLKPWSRRDILRQASEAGADCTKH